jgi:prephenate dehydrogenase
VVSAGDGGAAGRLLVIGTGLIGTSVALAAVAAGYEVWLDDRDDERRSLAVSMGAGLARMESSPVADLAVVAVPPAAVAAAASRVLDGGSARLVTHVASVQSQPQAELETLQPNESRFVGGHPVAGRERSGPHHASGELFRQRPWVICPTPASSEAAVAAVSQLAAACGAVVTVMSAAEHDALLARLSHSPQLVASALAAALIGLERGQVALAGNGLRDTSRLADSDAALWAEIVAANPAEVAAALRRVVSPLGALAEVLDAGDPAQAATAVRELVERGRHGRDLLAGKHGQPAVRWATVSVVVPDAPGALARLLADAAAAEVNVEDIRVDHSPGRPFGVCELDVAPGSDGSLARGLAERGWTATASTPPTDSARH